MDCTPRWEKICDLLEDALHELMFRRSEKHDLREVKPTWDELTRQYFAEELLSRPAVDSAARHLAKLGVAPANLPPDVRWYLGFRIQCAHDFLGMIFPPQSLASPLTEIPQHWTDEKVIDWLLVDLWFRRFDHWLKLEAIGALGPFAFYGIDPADPSKEMT